ncbi:MAG: hypothetical protein KF686_03615 [Ramlibacter sp.]|nr:hypothetical protein [Ramlibacter sp.]
MSTLTLHLMTQRDQPYGSERRCCERCGLMLVARPESFWREQTYTDNPEHWRHWPAGTTASGDEMAPCKVKAGSGGSS